MNLPDRFVLVKARIKTLRVTVPADLYSNGILAEVEGVEWHINTNTKLQNNPNNAELDPRKSEASSAKTDGHPDHRRSLRPKVHDPGGRASRPLHNAEEHDKSSDSVILPTTENLAKSFLQAEPKDEKAQLQAAVAQSQLMGESSSSAMSDEASTVGIGTGLTLPAFLSGFLKGIGDRFRLRVKDLKAEISLRLDLPTESSVASAASERSEKVTLRLIVKEVEYWSVPKLDSDKHTNTSQPKPTSSPELPCGSARSN